MKHETPSPASAGAVGAVHEQRGQHVHRRTITTDCWIDDDGRYTAIGMLRDDKGVPATTYALKLVKIGETMHDMRVVIELSPALVIEKITVDMHDVPGEPCRAIESNYDKIIGLSIARGFTRRLLERVGGTGGCQHVTTLLLQMAPAVIQAYMTAEAAKGFSPERWSALEGTCHVFRENGPGFENVGKFTNESPLKFFGRE